MKYVSLSDIESMPSRYRATFINSMTGFRSTALIGTADTFGNYNLAIFNSIVHLGSNPPIVGFVMRPDTVDRHTLDNIKSIKHYTINNVGLSFIEKAHQTSAKYDRSISEFEVVGLTPELHADFPVPLVKEATIKYVLELSSIMPIQENGTMLIIGRIQGIFLKEEIINEDGFVKLDEAEVITSLGLDAYYSTSMIRRFPYAKP